MRDETKNNRERKVQITVLEREPTTEGRESNQYKRVIWRASVASETLTGVKMKKSGMFVYLFIYIYVWTYVCHFVL